MFTTTYNKGFHITFKNGVTVSVQWGYWNYCENYNKAEVENANMLDSIDSKDAEIAVWDKNSTWILKKYAPYNDDDVMGYVTPEQVLDIMNWASKYEGE